MITGDCLFQSFAHVIETECDRHDITPAHLRAVVCDAVRRYDDENVNEAIEQWARLHDDLEAERASHASGVAGAAPDNVVWRRLRYVSAAFEALNRLPDNKADDRAFRECLADAMTNPSLYWGDEFALYVLEREFELRIVVLQGIETARPARRRIYVPKTHVSDPSWTDDALVVFVRHELDGEHYEPVSMAHDMHCEHADGTRPRYVWFFHELPAKIRRILRGTPAPLPSSPKWIRVADHACDRSRMALVSE